MPTARERRRVAELARALVEDDLDVSENLVSRLHDQEHPSPTCQACRILGALEHVLFQNERARRLA